MDVQWPSKLIGIGWRLFLGRSTDVYACLGVGKLVCYLPLGPESWSSILLRVTRCNLFLRRKRIPLASAVILVVRIAEWRPGARSVNFRAMRRAAGVEMEQKQEVGMSHKNQNCWNRGRVKGWRLRKLIKFVRDRVRVYSYPIVKPAVFTTRRESILFWIKFCPAKPPLPTDYCRSHSLL